MLNYPNLIYSGGPHNTIFDAHSEKYKHIVFPPIFMKS
jgi:hypothetical protein